MSQNNWILSQFQFYSDTIHTSKGVLPVNYNKMKLILSFILISFVTFGGNIENTVV